MRSFFGELRRRNVLRAAALYVAGVWALAQGIAQLGPVVGAPDWIARWFLVAAAIGFPFWTAFAWFYEFTRQGLKRESDIDPAQSITAHTGKNLDRWIFAIMGVAIVLLLTDRFVLHHGVNEEARVAVSAQSIAVLPFANMSSDKEQDYFADGISEDLLNLLAKVQTLQVAARTSSFSFKGKQIGIPEIAQTLHVANVLDGSVRKSGDQVRITAQLIRAADGYQIWSQSWDRKLDDVFAIQDSIAADVVKQLEVKLLGAVPTARPTDPKAYALYLQARQLGYQHSAGGYEQSDALLRQALAIDPNYVPAWTTLAANWINKAGAGYAVNDEAYRQAGEAVDKALAIDPDSAAAYGVLGRIKTDRGDLAAAASNLRRALELNPADVVALGTSAGLLSTLGRQSESIAVSEYIVARDPANARQLANLAFTYVSAHRLDEAITAARRALRLSPGRGSTNYALGIALLLQGDPPAALAEMQKETSDVWRLIGTPMVLHALGRKDEADAAVATLIEKLEKDAPFNIAYVYAFRGDADKAFEWLDKAIQYADPGLSEIGSEAFFANIHSDPRWLPFLRRVGYAPEQLAKIEFKVTLPQATPN